MFYSKTSSVLFCIQEFITIFQIKPNNRFMTCCQCYTEMVMYIEKLSSFPQPSFARQLCDHH